MIWLLLTLRSTSFLKPDTTEISEMLLKAQKFAEDIDKSNPVRRIASADLSADPDALES